MIRKHFNKLRSIHAALKIHRPSSDSVLEAKKKYNQLNARYKKFHEDFNTFITKDEKKQREFKLENAIFGGDFSESLYFEKNNSGEIVAKNIANTGLINTIRALSEKCCGENVTIDKENFNILTLLNETHGKVINHVTSKKPDDYDRWPGRIKLWFKIKRYKEYEEKLSALTRLENEINKVKKSASFYLIAEENNEGKYNLIHSSKISQDLKKTEENLTQLSTIQNELKDLLPSADVSDSPSTFGKGRYRGTILSNYRNKPIPTQNDNNIHQSNHTGLHCSGN